MSKMIQKNNKTLNEKEMIFIDYVVDVKCGAKCFINDLI